MVLPLSLPLAPGVDVMRTAFQVGRGLVSSNLIRHRNGLIQKLGGCTRLTSLTFQGICRCLFAWEDLLGNHYLAVGTNQLISLFVNGAYVVIQPIGHTTSAVPEADFSTVAGSNTVTINDTTFSPAVGSWINIVNLTYINGILLQGPYQVQSLSGSNYTITAATAATATGTGAAVITFITTNGKAAVQITLGSYAFTNNESITVGVSTTVGGLVFLGPYTVSVSGSGLIDPFSATFSADFGAGPSGPVMYTVEGSGNATSSATGSENGGNIEVQYFATLPAEGALPGAYGAGAYGIGPYGIGASTSASNGLQGSEPGVAFALEWSMDKFGQDLVFCWITSTVYVWVPPVSTGNVATPVSGAPSAVTGLFVAAPQQQCMAWGIFSATIGEQDPLLIGWCDVANLNAWTASATNQAGSFRLASGNLIISGTWFGLTGLFWTEIDLWGMTYVGFPLVYGFNKIAPNCGLIARRAWATLGTLAVWMSQQDFFVYQGGSVAPLPCTVHDFVFNTLDKARLEEIHADTNSYNGEVTWWFPQIGSNGQCTGAVKWHAAGGEWDITSSGLSISAWTDQSVLGPPIGTFYNGLLEQFETSTDFDGQILDSFILSGFFQLGEAEEIIFVERVYPDFTLSPGATINVSFMFADDMASAEIPGSVRTYGPYQVTSSTPYLIVRGRGRVMQIRVDGNVALNSFWRYGEPPVTSAIDGRK
jgi:hypothetical protein